MCMDNNKYTPENALRQLTVFTTIKLVDDDGMMYHRDNNLFRNPLFHLFFLCKIYIYTVTYSSNLQWLALCVPLESESKK